MPRRAEDKDIAVELAARIGARVRELRVALALTQDDLSEKLGMTPEALGRLERGVALPSFPTFMRLCGALETTPDALLRDEGGAAPARREIAQVERLAVLAAELTPQQQRVLLAVAREFRAGRVA
jgi:transcriptional regulator with XRE-family HTH domain